MDYITKDSVITNIIQITSDKIMSLISVMGNKFVCIANTAVTVDGQSLYGPDIFNGDTAPIIVMRTDTGNLIVGHINDYLVEDPLFGRAIIPEEILNERYVKYQPVISEEN